MPGRNLLTRSLRPLLGRKHPDTCEPMHGSVMLQDNYQNVFPILRGEVFVGRLSWSWSVGAWDSKAVVAYRQRRQRRSAERGT